MKDRLTDEDGWDQITELGRTQIERGQTTQIEYKMSEHYQGVYTRFRHKGCSQKMNSSLYWPA